MVFYTAAIAMVIMASLYTVIIYLQLKRAKTAYDVDSQ